MSYSRTIALIFVLLFLIPPVVVAVSPITEQAVEEVEETPWWETTNMDENRDRIHDAIPLAAAGGGGGGWLDEDNTISVIVDFDHTPTEADQLMLEERLHFKTQFRYHLIDSMAGRIPLEYVNDLVELPGVVFVELDGRLTTAMDHVVESHGVTQVWEDTGYTGAGSVVSIIDTGIDGMHVGLDDLDDDNSTNDPKIIAFYDPVNNPNLENGTEVFPYDDQGHGTHCAGITAGTGAPDDAYVGVAPQAQLVGVKVLDEGGSGSFATVMRGMEWTVEKKHDFNIRAASMSLGGPGAIEWTSSEEESVNRMGNEMMRSGIALFIAAGNNGVSFQIGTPGSAEDAITVGALDKDTSIAIYSSQGPTEEGRVKPNIAYMGSSIMSVAYNTGDQYTAMSGTSMATPNVVGVIANYLETNPSELIKMIKISLKNPNSIISADRWLSQKGFSNYGFIKYLANFFFQKFFSSKMVFTMSNTANYAILSKKKILNHIKTKNNDIPCKTDIMFKNNSAYLLASAKKSMNATSNFAKLMDLEVIIISDQSQGHATQVAKEHASFIKSYIEKIKFICRNCLNYPYEVPTTIRMTNFLASTLDEKPMVLYTSW